MLPSRRICKNAKKTNRRLRSTKNQPKRVNRKGNRAIQKSNSSRKDKKNIYNRNRPKDAKLYIQ